MNRDVKHIRDELIKYYNITKTRSLSLGIKFSNIIFEDVFIVYVNDDNQIILMGFLEEKIDLLKNYYDFSTNYLILPDYFDIIMSLAVVKESNLNKPFFRSFYTDSQSNLCDYYKYISLGDSISELGYTKERIVSSHISNLYKVDKTKPFASSKFLFV